MTADRAESSGELAVERIAPRAPPLFDGRLLLALALPALAVGCFAAALARESIANGPTDPASLLLRVIAYGLGVTATYHLVVVGRRVALFLSYQRQGLTLRQDALVITTARGDVAIAKRDIVAIVEPGAWGEHTARRRWTDVYVVLHPRAGRTHETLPPVYELAPGELVEHLMRWRGPVARDSSEDRAEEARSEALPSKIYDEAARTKSTPGGFVIRAGRGWIARGPYATTLLGLSIVDGFARATPATRALLAPEMVAIVAFALFLVPVAWWSLAVRGMRPKKGLSLVLTPTDALLRAESGVLRIPYRTIGRLGMEERRAWSVLLGLYRARTVVIERNDGTPTIRYDESFLGVPGDVVVALLEAGKRGALA